MLFGNKKRNRPSLLVIYLSLLSKHWFPLEFCNDMLLIVFRPYQSYLFCFLTKSYFSATQKVCAIQISHSIVSISDQTRQFSIFMIYLILYKNRWYLSISNKHISALKTTLYDTILLYH